MFITSFFPTTCHLDYGLCFVKNQFRYRNGLIRPRFLKCRGFLVHLSIHMVTHSTKDRSSSNISLHPKG